jgi:hypothetical protein
LLFLQSPAAWVPYSHACERAQNILFVRLLHVAHSHDGSAQQGGFHARWYQPALVTERARGLCGAGSR